jgi:ATP-dependent Lon protease
LEIPWGKKTQETININKARKLLNDEHYGLDNVKERICEYLAVKQLSPEIKGGLICLVGPPGTGKTSIAQSIAKATNRKLVRISLGGVHDEAEIRGHRRTYIGSMPGRIISGIIQAGSCNPLMVLDEIDKLGSDYRGDPSAALLEAFDGEQNSSFRDNYLELPFDLSEVFFITTANSLDTIPRALLDRMEVIELHSYTDEEKLQIAKNHLIPKQRKKHGLRANQLKFEDGAIREMIRSYTRESGVRILEREIAATCRKAASGIAEEKFKSLTMRPGQLEEVLGPAKYKPDEIRKRDEVGLVRGLAYTSVGGEVLDVEVAVLDGSGRLELTGNLGDVMKESAKAALSYIRSRADVLGIAPDFYKTKDIHIHFPEGAVPKDGPSAGITMTIAMISALTGTPVRHDVAMTGEITLRGRVLPIGGLREKTMAALRAGIKTVIIPAENESDLDKIDQLVRKQLNFVPTDHVDKVLDLVLVRDNILDSETEKQLCAAAIGGTEHLTVRQ